MGQDRQCGMHDVVISEDILAGDGAKATSDARFEGSFVGTRDQTAS